MGIAYLPLKAWHQHWRLEAPWVFCRYCRSSQSLIEAAAFPHARHCPRYGLDGQYPCRELAQILQAKIDAGLF
jgi:hypothetical protein